MIINGGSRSNGSFFARHLMRADQNERVTVSEMRGFAYAQDVPEAFAEMRDLASGTRCKNFFYHANLNTRAEEQLTPEQWAQAVDKLESELHLQGQPRLVVEHDKEGRVHRHVVWSRIDADTMTAVSDSHNYRTHELVATELETAFGHAATERALTRDKETPRPEPAARDWETFRAQESKIDPKAMKAELTELWQHSDSGAAFAAAIEERGYILAKGDRRDFCVIDQAGDEHSLARRIAGVKAAEIRSRMAEVDRDALPSVEAARALARNRPEEPNGEPADTLPAPSATPGGDTHEPPAALFRSAAPSPFQAILAERIEASRVEELPATFHAANRRAERDGTAFDFIMSQTVREADPASTGDDGNGWERFSAWLSTMRAHVTDFGQQVREYWNGHFGGPAPEAENQSPSAETPDTTIGTAGARIGPMSPRHDGPELG